MSSDSLSYRLYHSTPLEEYDLALELALKNVLMSAFPAYKSRKFDSIREKFQRLKINMCYDSGGFQILMKPELIHLACPLKTLEVYERLGYTDKDLLIQLDLPTDFHDTIEKREDWITKSALYYHQMREKNKQIIPVIHGWTYEELAKSLEMVFQPETIAFGSNSATETRGVKAAIGSYVATERPKPRVGNQYVGIGSYTVKEVPTVMKTASVSSGTAEERRKFTPMKVIYPRFGLAVSLMKKLGIKHILALGGGGMNFMHLAFSSGCDMTDGSSWRIAARFFSFFVPETANRRLKEMEKPTCKKATTEDILKLRELHKEPEYPFSDISFEELLTGLAAEKKFGFVTRCIHNAYVLHWEITNISQEYANDPDGYWNYLLNKRWANSNHWKPRAKLVRKALTEDYVQTSMRSYLKLDSQFSKMLTQEARN